MTTEIRAIKSQRLKKPRWDPFEVRAPQKTALGPCQNCGGGIRARVSKYKWWRSGHAFQNVNGGNTVRLFKM
jgi:hypothetical protein